jgi:monoamine oxidase
MNAKRVAIIGGGPGGLMAAYLLEQRAKFPCRITLFEAGNRLGGKIVSRTFATAPVPYEAGAAELYDYSQLGPDPLRELVAEMGLTTTDMRGGTVVLGDRILKNEADIRAAFGESTTKALKAFNRKARGSCSPAEYYESDWKADNADPLSRQKFAEVIGRVSDETARQYIRVAVHSDLATEPNHTSAMYGLQNYLMDEPDYMRLYTIDGGIERLPQELAKRISARVMFHHPVVRVERTGPEQYRVTTRHQRQLQSEDFDFVVVALPNNWIPAIHWGGELLSGAMESHHAFYDYPAHYLRVSILFEKPFWRDRIADSFFMLDAFGGCCVYDESSRGECGGFGVLGWLLAGESALSMSNFADAELVGHMLDSLPSALQHGRNLVREGRVHRWVGTVNGWPGGCPARDPDSRHQPEPIQHPRLFVVGDYLFDSTINGVLDSADTVVEWIIEDVTSPAVTSTVNGSANGTPAAPVYSSPEAPLPTPSPTN